MEIELIASIIFSALSLTGALIYVKSQLHNFRLLVDSVDDAVKDNSVTEEEFRTIWGNFKKLTGSQ